MGINLTNLLIDQTFQQLTQISGSVLTDGTGSLITNLDISASFATEADNANTSDFANTSISSSHALNADNSISSSHSVTADSSSFANTSISSSHALTADTSISSSYATNALSASTATTASYALNGGVTSITAGTNVTINQSQGDVTINSSGGDSFPYTGSAVISGSLNVIGDTTLNGGNIQFNTPSTVNVNGTGFNVNLTSTGSTSFQIDRTGVGGLNLSIGGYEGFGGWKTTASQTFYGIDQAFFSAEKDFYIKNLSNGQGSINVWSENDLILRGDTGVVIQGSDPFGPTGVSEDIDIYGAAIATSISSGINGFAYEIFENTRVRGVRAFVETPLQIQVGVTLTVEQYGTLKVINEL